MTEWKTIRVPEADRDECKAIRPDDATYGDCLVAGAQVLADERDDTGDLDTEELAELLSKKLGADFEMAAFRGASDAIEEASR